MADIADFTSTFDNKFFQTACQDVLRIVSILSLESTHVTVPEKKKSFVTNFFEKSTFMGRFFYMVFVKGFTRKYSMATHDIHFTHYIHYTHPGEATHFHSCVRGKHCSYPGQSACTGCVSTN